jgi:hypothetical protein
VDVSVISIQVFPHTTSNKHSQVSDIMLDVTAAKSKTHPLPDAISSQKVGDVCLPARLTAKLIT